MRMFAMNVVLAAVSVSAAWCAGAAFSQTYAPDDFKLTDCALREMKGLKGGRAVMLNADRGFVRNSRGWAEAVFTAPTSGWYRVAVTCAAKIRTPLEIWINDADKVVLDCPGSQLRKFRPLSFTHRFAAGRNVLRLLGPGSAYYVAVARLQVDGPVTEPPPPAPSDPAAVAAKIDADFAGRTVTNAPNVTWLEPPRVAVPFRMAIDRVSPENEVVYYSGTVSPKAADSAVEVTYRVTGPDGRSARTKPVRVLVKGLGETRRTFVNPLGDGADPFVNRIDGWYYHIQAKHGKERASLYLRRTRSFIDYGSAKPVRIHTFGPYSEETHTSEVWGWFPIIKWTDGHYYIFYAACRRHDTASHRMFVLKSKKADNPFSGYEELGMVDTGGVWAIGLNYFQWKGRYYAVWSGWRKQDRVHLPQCSYLARMENPWTIGPRVEISAPTLPWEGLDAGTPIQEGAMVYEVDGKLVMLYSANASFSNRYAIGMLVYVGGDTEADLLNPANWVKRPEPFLSGTDAILAPGVPGLTQSPDGKEWWLLYHVAKYDGAGWCRQVMAQVVGTDEKGLPHVRKPASYYVPMYLPSGDGFTPPARTILDASRAVPGGRAASLREPFSAYGRVVRLAASGDTASYRFEVKEGGTYAVTVRFACFAPESALGLAVNGGSAAELPCRYLGPEDYNDLRTKVRLKAGANELVLSHLRGGAVKVDLVVLGPSR